MLVVNSSRNPVVVRNCYTSGIHKRKEMDGRCGKDNYAVKYAFDEG